MFDVIVNIYECFLMTFFVTVCTPRRKRSIPAFICCAVTLFVFISVCNLYSPSEGFLSAVDVLILWLYCRFISRADMRQDLLISVMACVIITVINLLLAVTVGNLMYQSVYYETFMADHSVCIIVLAQILHTLVYYLVVKRFRHIFITYDGAECLRLSFVFILSDLTALCIHAAIMNNSNADRELTVGVICNTLMIFCLVRFFNASHQRKLEHERTRTEVIALREQQISNEKILAAQQEIQQTRHDMKHLIQVVSHGLKTVPNDEIAGKLAEFEDRLKSSVPPVYTNVQAVNFILNMKREEAFKKQIEFTCRLNVTGDPGLQDPDMYLLLGNALDNAVQHIGRAKKILVEMKDVGEMFMIRITNSIDSPVLDKDGDLIVERNAEGHGYGVTSMKQIVRKYSGFIAYTEEKENLICTILLKKKPVAVPGVSRDAS